MRRSALGVLIPVLLTALALSQEQPKPTPQLNPIARLRAAKTAYVNNGGGSDFPFKLFESSMEGWARLTLVDSAEKADIVVEITSPTDDSGIYVSSSTTPSTPLGAPGEQSTKITRQLSVQRITVTVYDPRSNFRLWSASERPKSAMKQKAREDNIVDATQSLFSKFKEMVEPTPSQ